jgi:2-oxoisovalerate dehydrogenase E1 component
MSTDLELFKKMLLIRKFEERLLNEFSSGKLVGTTHAYIGQEANAVGILDNLDKEDIIFSNHRCHGHFLAYGGDPYLLAAEIMGKPTGLVGGRGGSQHIQWRNFYSNGIQGGIVPIGVGMAFAEKQLRSDRIVVVFMGDGTLGQGIVYESFNFASLWKIPVLFVIENNLYAQTTPIEKSLAGRINDRVKAFGIHVWECNTTDVLEIREESSRAVNYVRAIKQPACLILNTYRFSAHSKGDEFRDPAEISRYMELDPIPLQKKKLNEVEATQAELEIISIVNIAFNRAESDLPTDNSKLTPILL